LCGKLGRSQPAERAVWAELVVIFAEGLDQFTGVREVDKFVFVKAFVAELPVEAFDVAVLGWFAWCDEAVRDLTVVGPAFQRQAGKLRPVVGDQTGRSAAEFRHIVQHPRHAGAGQRGVGLDPQALAGVTLVACFLQLF